MNLLPRLDGDLESLGGFYLLIITTGLLALAAGPVVAVPWLVVVGAAWVVHHYRRADVAHPERQDQPGP